MFGPGVQARLEDSRSRLCELVKTTYISRLIEVTGMARKCQVVFLVSSTKSGGNDVVNLERKVEGDFRGAAVFAPPRRR